MRGNERLNPADRLTVHIYRKIQPAIAQLPASWTACALLLPHAQAVLDPAAPGMHQIAGALGNSGSYPAARDLAQQIAAERERDENYGPEHPDTLSVRSHLASWTGAAGDAAGARDQHAALLPVMERILGPEDFYTPTRLM